MTGLRDTSVNAARFGHRQARVFVSFICVLDRLSTGTQRVAGRIGPLKNYVLIAKGKLVNRYDDFGLARRSLQVIIWYRQYRCILRAKRSAAGGIGESKIDGFVRLINAIVDDRNRKRFDNFARCKTQRA
jgi:hypothetical protein